MLEEAAQRIQTFRKLTRMEHKMPRGDESSPTWRRNPAQKRRTIKSCRGTRGTSAEGHSYQLPGFAKLLNETAFESMSAQSAELWQRIPGIQLPEQARGEFYGLSSRKLARIKRESWRQNIRIQRPIRKLCLRQSQRVLLAQENFCGLPIVDPSEAFKKTKPTNQKKPELKKSEHQKDQETKRICTEKDQEIYRGAKEVNLMNQIREQVGYLQTFKKKRHPTLPEEAAHYYELALQHLYRSGASEEFFGAFS